MKPRMTRKRYLKRMKQHQDHFDKFVWKKIVSDTNDYISDNGFDSNIAEFTPLEKTIDSLCLSGAWIKDRLSGYIGTSHSSTYRFTLTKKIRKALGYTL